MRAHAALIACLLPALLAACHDARQPEGHLADPAVGTSASLGDGVAFHFIGTEPFWSGAISRNRLTYNTPELVNPAPAAVPVTRFVGMGGVGFSGTLLGAPLEMAVSQATCSDGMSDRVYAFTVTLRVQGQDRTGCGWIGDALPPQPPHAQVRPTSPSSSPSQ